MTDERTMLIAQIKKHTEEGMGYKFIPSIPDVFEFVAWRTHPDGAAETGLTTLRSVTFSRVELEPFERSTS
jgi:hypothetical protein